VVSFCVHTLLSLTHIHTEAHHADPFPWPVLTHGRLDTEEQIQASIDSCPVSCIHWVQKEDLPALEYVMQVRMKRAAGQKGMEEVGRISHEDGRVKGGVW
jgi:hypothetical protein